MEFASHGSLGTLLLKQDVVIDWKLRLKFATDIGASSLAARTHRVQAHTTRNIRLTQYASNGHTAVITHTARVSNADMQRRGFSIYT